jgi:hypothetical protein
MVITLFCWYLIVDEFVATLPFSIDTFVFEYNDTYSDDDVPTKQRTIDKRTPTLEVNFALCL